jgi:hypothetical protein
MISQYVKENKKIIQKYANRKINKKVRKRGLNCRRKIILMQYGRTKQRLLSAEKYAKNLNSTR